MQDEKTTDISISQLREDAFAVLIGYFGLLCLPVGMAFAITIVLSSVLVALGCNIFAACAFALLAMNARSYTANSLKLLIALCVLFLTLEVILAVLIWNGMINEASREQQRHNALIFSALLIEMSLLAYWTQIRPIAAALRLLAAHVPFTGQKFTSLMEQSRSPQLFQRPTGGLSALSYCVVGVALIIVPAVGAFWWLLFGDSQSAVIAFPVLMGATLLGPLLYRRGLRLSAISAAETLRKDTRAPVLFLRSFMDDAEPMTDIRFGRARKNSRLDTLLAPRKTFRGGRRLEELVAKVVARLGPFVAIGDPSDRLPEIGAARAYHSDDTWQSAIKQWVDTAQLIIQLAGPTSWIRWELDTILARSAGPKLILVFPPAPRGDHGERWTNISGALENTAWGDAFAKLDAGTTLALRLLPEGKICAVSSRKHAIVDYTLAMRILLGSAEQAREG
jgi:hypothetical protein